MITDKEFSDSIHMIIHSLRLLSSYKPSQAEIKISKLVIEKYSDTCRECKEAGERIKNPVKKDSFFNKLGEVFDND